MRAVTCSPRGQSWFAGPLLEKLGSRTKRDTMLKHMSTTLLVCLIGLGILQPTQASGLDESKNIKLEQELSGMDQEIKTILAQQQQLIAKLNELKPLAATETLPTSQLPAMFNIHGEPFEGNNTARIRHDRIFRFRMSILRRV